MPPVQKSLSSSSLHRYVILTCAEVQATKFKTQMHEWSVGFTVLRTKGGGGVRSGSPTQYRFALIVHKRDPCYLHTDSNMTRHSERAQRRRRLLQAGPLGNISGGTEPCSGSPACAFNLQTTCSQAANPVPPPALAPPPPLHTHTHLSPQTSPLLGGSAHCRTSLLILLLTYWWLILIVVAVVTVVLFLLFALPPMTSVSPCTIPQTRPTKLALMKGQDKNKKSG